MTDPDTIVAPATPPGVGGLAVVRLSGPRSGEIIRALDSRHHSPEHRQAVLIRLKDISGQIFDDAVATFFQAPHSYTGEDLVEISCHGNPLIVQHLVEDCCRRGARVAHPGEFTQRAFIHGKMDLIQAEAVASFIEAQSLESARLNHRILQGELSSRFQELKTRLLSLLQSVEYILDITEEEPEAGFFPNLLKNTATLAHAGKALLATYRRGHLLTEGATIVLSGPPNSGKSTLLNRLSNSDRAITSPNPGTTRDYIDVRFNLNGIPIKLVDTAGLRESTDLVEEAGISHTRRLMENADILVWVQSVETEPVEAPTEPRKPDLLLFNKSDLPGTHEALKDQQTDALLVSALRGDGIEEFKAELLKKLGGATLLSSGIALTTARQHAALTSFLAPLQRSLALLDSPEPPLEIISFEFREALQSLDVLLGKTTPDDIINAIFGTFCVGK